MLPGAEPGARGFKELGGESLDLVGRLGQDTHSVSLCFHHGELGPVIESTGLKCVLAVKHLAPCLVHRTGLVTTRYAVVVS